MNALAMASQTPLAFIEQNLEEMASCDANLKTINSTIDQEIFEIRKKNSLAITELQQKKDLAFNNLEAFAIENQRILFSVKRSMKTKFGNFGFRTGKPKFQLLEGFTWANINTLLQQVLPSYVRTVVEPSKEKLMADRMLPEVSRYFPAMGLTVVQDDAFFVDLKKG